MSQLLWGSVNLMFQLNIRSFQKEQYKEINEVKMGNFVSCLLRISGLTVALRQLFLCTYIMICDTQRNPQKDV